MQSFNQQGLRDIIPSWVGTETTPPSPRSRSKRALGSDVIQQLAEKSGISIDAAKAQLAELLPSLIDKITPEGRFPRGASSIGSRNSCGADSLKSKGALKKVN